MYQFHERNGEGEAYTVWFSAESRSLEFRVFHVAAAGEAKPARIEQ